MKRVNRRYRLTFFTREKETLQIEYPFRVQFKASQKIGNLRGGLNELNLSVYNLSPSNRLKLVQDDIDTKKDLRVVFEAGYEDELRIIYQGTIFKGDIEKNGADYINKIQCKDGGEDFLNSFVSGTVTTKNQAINEIIKNCKYLKKGKINIDNDFLSPKPLYGNIGKVLKEIPNEDEELFIRDEKIYLLKKNQVTEKYIPLINADTGLIKASRSNKRVTIETLFNPALKMGMKCKLESIVNPYLDSEYKIDSINYTGDADSNDWKMEIELLSGVFNV